MDREQLLAKFGNGYLHAMTLSTGAAGFGGEVKIPRLLELTSIRLAKTENKRSEKSPDYIVETIDIDGDGEGYWAESGGAWIKKLNDDSGTFLSISLDMADKPDAISLAAFAADEVDQKAQAKGKGELYRFTYSRPRPRRERRTEDAKKSGNFKSPAY